MNVRFTTAIIRRLERLEKRQEAILNVINWNKLPIGMKEELKIEQKQNEALKEISKQKQKNQLSRE